MDIGQAIKSALQGKRIRNKNWEDKRAYCYALNVVSPKDTDIRYKPSKGKVSDYTAGSADLTSDKWEVIGDHK